MSQSEKEPSNLTIFAWASALVVIVFSISASVTGCQYLEQLVGAAGGPEKVIEGGFKLAEMIVPWPFDILLPGAASLVTALVMKNEEPAS